MPQQWMATTPLARTVEAAGFHYDPDQDIIFSIMNPWQRQFGYSKVYDDVAPASISAIIDCEPIYFTYAGKDWMIELWKGQYGMETGAEIGVYAIPSSSKTVKTVTDMFGYYFPKAAKIVDHASKEVKFYACASDSERLEMSFSLRRKGVHHYCPVRVS